MSVNETSPNFPCFATGPFLFEPNNFLIDKNIKCCVNEFRITSLK